MSLDSGCVTLDAGKTSRSDQAVYCFGDNVAFDVAAWQRGGERA